MDNNNKNTTHEQPLSEKKENRVLMSILAYLGPLVIISYIVSKDDPFVKFHIKQGLVLFIIEIIIWVLGPFLLSLWVLFRVINFIIFILTIIGIVNVINKKEKNLPIVGDLSRHFSF